MPSKLLPILLKNVESRMLKLGWDNGDLAEEMQVTHSYVTQILGGHRGVGLNTLDKIADALGVPAADLLKAPKTARKAS